jgi:hypothetical protein
MSSTPVYLKVGLAAACIAMLTSSVQAVTINVHAGDDLQAVLNAAQPGDVVLLDAGARFVGNFVLPVKAGSTYITIRSAAADNLLPPAGRRITPSYAALLPKIVSDNAAPALRAAAGAHHWRLQFLEFPATQLGAGEIVRLGEGASPQTSLSQVPYAIEVDRVYVHGDAVYGQKRGIALNSGTTTISNSYIAGIKSMGQDSQAIGGWNGPGPYTIENNYLEAAGENFLLGGSDPAIPGLVTQNVTFRYNHLFKPMAWRAEGWQVKNLFELKNGRHVVVEYNVFENNWDNAQPGYAILFTPRNQDGGCPWCVVEDVTFQYNIVRNTPSGINLSGYDYPNQSAQTNNIRIRQNLFYGLTQALGGAGWFMLIGDGPRDIVVDHNTVDFDGTTALYAYGGSASAPTAISGFQFTNNAVRHNQYGINGANFSWGNSTIAGYFSGGTVVGNWLPGGTANRYPAGNLFSGTFSSAFSDQPQRDYRPSAGSILLGAASDGTNVGADVAALTSGLTGVVEGFALQRPKTPVALRITR